LVVWSVTDLSGNVQGYLALTVKVLQSICKVCGRILLPDKARAAFLKQMAGRRKERGSNKALLKAIITECKKARTCHYCEAANGPVKKISGTFKLIHDPYTKQVRKPLWHMPYQQSVDIERRWQGCSSNPEP
jgi:hypothetical protein